MPDTSTHTELVAAIKAATNNVENMTDEEMRQLCNAACFLTAAIAVRRDESYA